MFHAFKAFRVRLDRRRQASEPLRGRRLSPGRRRAPRACGSDRRRRVGRRARQAARHHQARFDLDDAATDELIAQGDRGRAGGGRSLSLHQPAQPHARRRRPPPHGRDDVGDRLCRRPGHRVRGQSDLARRRSARRVLARRGSSCASAWRAAGRSTRRSAGPEASRRPTERRGDLMRPVTLITGASAGIGTALAHVFARHGHELVLVARREQRLAELADAIAAQGHKRPLVLPLDLARPMRSSRIRDALATARRRARDRRQQCRLRAGRRGGEARPRRAARHDRSQCARAHRSVARLRRRRSQRHRGGILNVASVAGFLPGPGMAVYYASKAYVLSFSEALHRELKPRGVRVTVLCPGPVPTEFQARAGVRKERYPSLVTQTAEQVAAGGLSRPHGGPPPGRAGDRQQARHVPAARSRRAGFAAAGVEAQQRLRQ